MLRFPWRCLLLPPCFTVGRPVKAVEILHSHWSIGRLYRLSLPLLLSAVETPGQSIDTTARLSETVNLQWCYGSVLSGCINLFGVFLLYLPMDPYLMLLSECVFLPYSFRAVKGVSPTASGEDLTPLLLCEMVALIVTGAIVKIGAVMYGPGLISFTTVIAYILGEFQFALLGQLCLHSFIPQPLQLLGQAI